MRWTKGPGWRAARGGNAVNGRTVLFEGQDTMNGARRVVTWLGVKGCPRGFDIIFCPASARCKALCTPSMGRIFSAFLDSSGVLRAVAPPEYADEIMPSIVEARETNDWAERKGKV